MRKLTVRIKKDYNLFEGIPLAPHDTDDARLALDGVTAVGDATNL